MRLAHDLVDPRPCAGSDAVACGVITSSLQPRGLGAEQLDRGRGGHEALDPVEQRLHPAVALGDDRHRDLGPLPLVVVAGLGHRDPEPVAQAVDDRADRGPLRLERAALGNVEIEAHGRRMHAPM